MIKTKKISITNNPTSEELTTSNILVYNLPYPFLCLHVFLNKNTFLLGLLFFILRFHLS